jgi:hypothetical protein
MKKSILSILTLATLFVACKNDVNLNDNDPIKQVGDITENTIWSADQSITISGPVVVKEGVTLTIEEGSTIKVEAGRTDTYLAVEQGAKLEAAGTAAAPITFTSNATSPAAGDWGGIVIAGKTQTNKGDSVESEVAGVVYGKSAAEAVPNDNSGTLTYVIAEYTGAKINGEQEFNGLSLYTVGSGTVIENIVIKNGADDGIEFFGGTVDVKNILCVNIADDMFDFTGGYTGTVTNAFGVRENGFDLATEDPRGIEGDSNGSDGAALPVSAPTFNGVTILNLNQTVPLKAGAEIRRGSIATINGAAFIAEGAATFGNLIDTKDDKGNGTLTISSAYSKGSVGSNKVGGVITGDVMIEADLFNGSAVKAGRGADFSVFAWSNYSLTESEVVRISGDISADATWSASKNYLINGPVVVKDGVTLTIEAGTTIKVDAGRTDTYLAVEQGAKLEAAGTAAAPIIFTSNAGSPSAGDWGGIVIAGKTQTNKGDSVESEVAGVTYGKSSADAVPNDNSGTLTYVIAEYTGAKINGEQEFNGLSLYTVGSGTVIENIVIKNGADDGIEFFGGTVDVKNILCVNIADDMFDFTGGYTGTVTNAFGVRENGFDLATEDPRGIEGDSNGSDGAATPVSAPTFNGVTILNLNTTVPLKAGAEIRRGTIATINGAAFIAATGTSFGNLIDTKDDKGNGSLTITAAYKQGVVGDNKEGGVITGTVVEEADLFVGSAVKAGRGADFSVFSWFGYSI